MEDKKIIFFDVDGTLLDSTTHLIPPSTLYALQALKQAGHILCIATGRSVDSLIDAAYDKLIDWDIFLCNNGQAIYDNNVKCIHSVPIPQHAVNACVKKAKELHSPLLIMGEISRLTQEADENVIISSDFFNEVIPPVLPYDGSPVIMMIAYGPADYDYHDYKDIDELTFIQGQSNYSDVVLKGFNKHIGIQFVLKHYQMKEYIAFGDSMNDLEMIEHATIGVAMGNACEELKAVASMISQDVAHDGIAYALKELHIL